MNNTIYALSSGQGKSGVFVVRISGPNAYEGLCKLLKIETNSRLEPRKAYLKKVYAREELIDQALVIFFRGPHSFTGEDVVELHLHGSLVVLKKLLDHLSGFDNFSAAKPGEFTRRAFENGKLDLLAVEALSDLIQAETDSQHKQAIRQMSGDVGSFYAAWQEDLMTALAFVEALIDFAEEEYLDANSMLNDTVKPILKRSLESMHKHLHAPAVGERIRKGVEIAILGAPNVGKSTLLNMLAGRPAAIVSARAGTTRDIIDIHLDVAGFPVIVRDTAGIYAQEGGISPLTDEDEIEREGIKRALACAQEADIRLFITSADQPMLPEAYRALPKKPHDLFIFNKADLGIQPSEQRNRCLMRCSLKHQIGVDTLLRAMEASVKSFLDAGTDLEFAVITRLRHREHLERCAGFITQAIDHMHQGKAIEFIAQDIRLSAQEINQILMGSSDVERVLDRVFAEFCIGK